MMTRRWLKNLVCAGLVLLPATVSAQGFHAVFSQDGGGAWAVGDGGVAYYTVNGGSTWASMTLGAGTLRDVATVGLRVLVVGDGGKVWRSENLGGAWTSITLPSSPALRGVAMPSALVAYAVGAGGTITKTVDGGVNWTPQTSGVSVMLNDVRFLDESTGWAVGDAGTVLRTVDGGASWNPVATGATKELFGVDVEGLSVWVVGAGGVARRSADGGSTWAPVHLKLDSRADVRQVRLYDQEVWLAGGGGFVRKSADHGVTWEYPLHPLQGQISGFAIVNGRAFACSNRHRVPMRSDDGGATWSLPVGATVNRSWVQKQSVSSARGSTFSLHPYDRNTIYCAVGANIYRSRDGGESWVAFASIPNTSLINAFLVSPKDTNDFVAAVRGTYKRVVKSTNHGGTWEETKTRDFGDYGIPLEMDPDHPDTVYFGADNDSLYRSVDFGKNWEGWGLKPGNVGFRSPCDIVVVPDSSNIVLLGDGITGAGNGDYFKSVDGGRTFTHKLTVTGSEIPGMAGSRLRRETVFGTNWGSGGVQRSVNLGENWPNVSSIGSAWGVDIADDDPNFVVFGVYTGGTTYLSLNGGTDFTGISLGGSNYGFYLRDRETVLALQSGGIYKLNTTFSYTPTSAQALSTVAPNGGQSWQAGSTQSIAWSMTNVPLVRVEYRTEPGQWQPILAAPGHHGGILWTVPCQVTSQARVRVVDGWDGAPIDSSDADFTIEVPSITADEALDFDARPVGSQTVLPVTLDNPWDVPLTITGIAVAGGGPFAPGRTGFTIPAGTSDTVGVLFEPGTAATIYDDTLVVTSAECNVVLARVALHGAGVDALLDAPETSAIRVGVAQNRPNPFRRTTEIEYAIAKSANVSLEVFDVQGHRVSTLASGRKEPGTYRVTFGPGSATMSGGRSGEIPAGVYFYRFQADRYTVTRKMLFLK